MTISKETFDEYFCTGDVKKDAAFLTLAIIFVNILQQQDDEQWRSFCIKHLPSDLINSSSDGPETTEESASVLAKHEDSQTLSTTDIMIDLKSIMISSR